MRTATCTCACVVGVALVGAANALAAAAPPSNSSARTVSGATYVGKTLSASHGGWANSPTRYAYQWALCSSTGSGCASISGATTDRYTITSAEVDDTLEVWVTATDSAGSVGPVSSQPSAVISAALPPTQTAAPTIVGNPVVGQTLVANPGTYSGGTVASYTYQWQSCNAGTLVCTNITGATTQDYTPTSAVVGQRLRVKIGARNPYGHVNSTTDASNAVSLAVTPVTTTLNASTKITTCCQVVHLSGIASPAVSGEQITIIAHRYGQRASSTAATALTGPSGAWTASVTPMNETTYTAQTSTSTSTPLVVLVHPRVGIGVDGNTFSAKITALGSFSGKVAYFQTMNANGSWKSLALVVIDAGSVAHFHVALARGHTYAVRIYLPRSQAGPGYLDGISHTRRVGGLTPL